MEKFIWEMVAKFRNCRTSKLKPLAEYIISKNISANHLTILSLICGILAAYFFLLNWWLLALFSLLHLLFDSLDGVIARLTTETAYGRYFDLAADSLPVILILIKIGWYFKEIFSYLAAGLFTLSLLFFFLSKLNSVFIPLRPSALLTALISTLPFLDAPSLPIITVAYLAGGVCSLYALARQLQLAASKK